MFDDDPDETCTADQLSRSAQEDAVLWYLEGGAPAGWDDAVLCDFEEICKLLRIDLDARPGEPHGGIYYSGFSCQGDGASFCGRYRYERHAALKIRQYAPQDETLHAIADELQDVQSRYFYGLEADITRHNSNYCHACTMDTTCSHTRLGEGMPADVDREMRELFRRLANWLYRQLDSTYTAETSHDAVIEDLTANGHRFTRDGQHVDSETT